MVFLEASVLTLYISCVGSIFNLKNVCLFEFELRILKNSFGIILKVKVE